MIRKIQFKWIPYEEQEELRELGKINIAARLCIDPPLDAPLIQKIETIEGVGWVEDGVDYAAVGTVSPNEILLESGCPGWCEHIQLIVHEVVEVLKEAGEINYDGPPLSPLILRRR